MQRNHGAVEPSTASLQERRSKHWIFLLLQAAQAHLTSDGNKGKGYDTHPFAGISHIDRTRNIFHNCHNQYLQGKAVSKNEERASILWKTVEKKGYEKINATQMTSISTQRIQQFQQKDKLFIYRYLSIILFVE